VSLRPGAEERRDLLAGRAHTRAVLFVSQNCPACRDTIGRLNLFPQLYQHVQVLDLTRTAPDQVSDPAVRALVDAYVTGAVVREGVQDLDQTGDLYRVPALVVERSGRYYHYTDLHPAIERLFHARLSEPT
jgi:hypothetical protein